jgi:hypothetical protein
MCNHFANSTGCNYAFYQSFTRVLEARKPVDGLGEVEIFYLKFPKVPPLAF